MADDGPYNLREDGYLNVKTDSKCVIYHPNLNVLLLLTRSSEVLVLDVNSGVVLQKSVLSDCDDNLHGTYLPGCDKVVFTDGNGIGVRKDYNGVLLLDTILQTPLTKTDDIVKLELLLSEAVLLQQSLRSTDLAGVDHVSEVLQELSDKIKEAQSKPKQGTKAQKWNSVCLELPHCSLKVVSSGLVQELKRQNRHIPALSIASAVSERLNSLLPIFGSDGCTADRALMFAEAARRDTFVKWPHMNYKWALPDQMAQAGFYHQPNSPGDDRAMCFTCNVCLVCWEPTDEPWSEHERHSPSCPFVKGEYTQNVPLSVTYATSPAMRSPSQCGSVSLISSSSVPELMATASSLGVVTIWNVSRQLKKETCLDIVTSVNSVLTSRHKNSRYCDIKGRSVWSDGGCSVSDQTNTVSDVVEIPLSNSVLHAMFDSSLDTKNVDITALSIVGRTVNGYKLNKKKFKQMTNGKRTCVRPSIVIGVSYSSPLCSSSDSRSSMESVWGPRKDCASSSMVQAMNDVNEASSRESVLLDIMKVSASTSNSNEQSTSHCRKRLLYIVLYDFHYSPRVKDDGEGKDCLSGKSQSSQAGGNAKKVVSGTGTSTSSGTRQDNMYQEIFLSKFLYDVPMIEEMSNAMIPNPDCLMDDLGFPSVSSSGTLFPPPPLTDSSVIYESSFGGPYSAINGTIDMYNDACAAPLLLKVNGGVSKKENANKTSIDTDSTENNKVEPVLIQCLPLPSSYFNQSDLCILDIQPTKDGAHILVVLAHRENQDDCKRQGNNEFKEQTRHTSSCDMDVDIDTNDITMDAVLREKYNSVKSVFETGVQTEPVSDNNIGSVFIIYALNFDGDVVNIDEKTVFSCEFEPSELCPTQVVLLPLMEKDDPSDSFSDIAKKGCPQGLAAVVCADGSIKIINLSSLKVVSEVVPDSKGSKYVSVTYCISLERLCACTDKGSLHFFMLNEDISSDDAEEDLLYKSAETSSFLTEYMQDNNSSISSGNYSAGHLLPSTSKQNTSASSSSSMDQLIVNQPFLNLSDLQLLQELMQFENLTPCYSATVPPCWSEMMQAQKQRRHPQHLQQGDDLQHTRTWRLQNDSTTWDEHIFELTLPRACCIGHVDLKFSLHGPCPFPPMIQITLLKQNASGIGKKDRMFSSTVDDHINFGLSGSDSANSKVCLENPVTSEEYLRSHNVEILCGPVNLDSCVDLSDQSGLATLTSPKLFKMRGRTLLLHIKALNEDREAVKEFISKTRSCEDKGSASKKSKLDCGKEKSMDVSEGCKMFNNVGVIGERLPTAVGKKVEAYLGCDWLHEVSITIRKTKQTNIPNERNQRCAMLESNSFVEKLLKVLYAEGGKHLAASQSIALDILIWIASVRLMRHRSSKGDVKIQQLDFVSMIEANLGSLVEHCLIMSGRSIARKCVKLIITCSEGMKNAMDCASVPFDGCVLKALLDWLPAVPSIRSAGALYWYFLLLRRVMTLDVSATAAQKCVQLLQQVAQELHAKSNPFHLLLRTRFGLYGTPFDRDLFDVEPPTPAKSSSIPVTYASVASQDTAAASVPTMTTPPDSLDLRDLLGITGGSFQFGGSEKNGWTKLKSLSSNNFIKGLLEVEPLHFTCHAASDGTKMEKIEAGLTPGTGGSTIMPVANFMDTLNFVPISSGTKKADSDLINFYEDIKKDDSWNTVHIKMSGDHNNPSVTMMPYGLHKKVDVLLKYKHGHPVQFGGVRSGNAADTDTSSTSSSQQSLANADPLMFQNVQQNPPIMSESDRKPEEKKDGSLPFSWQQLLLMPSQHMLVIERMHSGARRFVVLDFGSPVLLTDLMIPACSELVSLSIDIWCHGEESDGQRLVVAPDIGTKSLVMSDIQPPTVCRYLKLTTIGRYGMSSTKCKIPIGCFYGHMVILQGECSPDVYEAQGLPDSSIQTQLNLLTALFEDIHCRYSLACARLQELLMPFLNQEIPNVVHMHHYLQKGKENTDKKLPSTETQKVTSTYYECITFQHQLNLVRNVMWRLESSQGKVQPLPDIHDMQRVFSESSSDKLRVLSENLLDILLYQVYEIGPVPKLPLSVYQIFNQQLCEELFSWLCVKEDTRMQVSTCTLLVRMCGLQDWWGDFLAKTLSILYSSQNSEIFPQDRVFILLTYLGRKSLCAGASRCSVFNSVLHMLSKLLLPLASYPPVFLRTEMDIGLISWLLLFLSVCLDISTSSNNNNHNNNNNNNTEEASDKNKCKDQGYSSRWDFIQGEAAMHRKMSVANRNSASRNYRRKLQKRLMHHKQQLEDLEAAKKAFHASTQVQALTALSNQAANLTNKLEAALKQQEIFYKKTIKQQTAKHFKDILQIRRIDGPMLGGRGYSQRHTREQDDMETERESLSICLPQSYCLPVARGLISLILQMNFTCNMDVFLLACKVVARLSGSTRPPIVLSQLMSEEELLQLVNVAAAWSGPWSSHAVCCLLQDIIESEKTYMNVQSSETIPKYNRQPETISPVEVIEVDPVTPDSPDASCIPGTSGTSNNNKVLPSLLESDDSELDDFLDDILERGKSVLKKGSSHRFVVVGGMPSSISCTLDARLEYGVESDAEVILKRLSIIGAYSFPLSISAAISPLPDSAKQQFHYMWDDSVASAWQRPGMSSLDTVQMLSKCFDKIFTGLHSQTSVNLEMILQLWMMLNTDMISDSAVTTSFLPTIPLSEQSISGILSAFMWHPSISLRTWCLGFQVLTISAMVPSKEQDDTETVLSGIAQKIVRNPNFIPLLLKFLSGSAVSTYPSATSEYAGPTICQALHDFIVRLQVRCDVTSTNSRLGNELKELLLKLIYQLVQPTGPLAYRRGPLDAQCKVVELLFNLNFINTNLGTAMSILASVGMLVHSYILSQEKVKYYNTSDLSVSASSCFGGLFASILGVESKQGKPASWDTLLCNLLKLVNNLVQTPLKSNSNQPSSSNRDSNPRHMDGIEMPDVSLSFESCESSRTDEHKAAEQMNTDPPAYSTAKSEVKIPCVADTVLQHHPTMLYLLSALACCSGSTLSMLIGSYTPSEHLTIGELEPLSVGDTVFQLLTTLARKATSHQLILKPLFYFISSGTVLQGSSLISAGVNQLSEPLLWFILRVLETDTALSEFAAMGGVKIVCENLVRSNQALINSHPSLVSVVMQHLSYLPPSVYVTSKKSTSAASSSAVDNCEGLINFAPLGTITSSNPTAQPAEVLIQSAPPHRRARTPAWSYHFYPDETWVELTITLPCAIMLKEVQLMPHLTSLATCPSAVAVEVSRDSGSFLTPICCPISTGGLTYVSLTLPFPEIVTTVLIRLYKPRDSSNIGLSQIRLLGTTTFGETMLKTMNVDVPDEEQLTKSSLGWLRLLQHCLNASDKDVCYTILTAASQVPGLLHACCGLLMIPAPSPSLFAPHLERVLLKLGLHNIDLGLRLIDILLSNGAAAFLQGPIPAMTSSVSPPTVVDSIVDLLYKLCTTQDSGTKDRVEMLLNWLSDVANKDHKLQPSAAYVHCIAAVLWSSHHTGALYNLPSLITTQLFSVLYKWTLSLPVQSALKCAIDLLLCSMCYIKPVLFPVLLHKMGVLLPSFTTHHSASVCDDRKDNEPEEFHGSLTDDSKNRVLETDEHENCYNWITRDLHSINLSESHLMTIAAACQSPQAVEQLLNSGLPHLLTKAVLEFCHWEQQQNIESSSQTRMEVDCGVPTGERSSSRMTDNDKAKSENNVNSVLPLESITVILDFFAEVCFEPKMKNWLGSSEGSAFWLPLLTSLCTKSSCKEEDSYMQNRCNLTFKYYSALEAATIKFLSRCCWCHQSNQKLLSKVLCDVISQQKTVQQNVTFLHGISGFTRRLVLQLLLENEKLFVFVSANFPLHRSNSSMAVNSLRHPRFGVGHQQQLLYVNTQTTCADILKLVTVPGNLVPYLGDAKSIDPQSGQGNNCENPRKDLWQLGIGLVDQLSVAAGVTAKDKRTKDAKNTAAASCSKIVQPKKCRPAAGGLLECVSAPQHFLHHDGFPGTSLPSQLTMAQLLAKVHTSTDLPCIMLNISKDGKSNTESAGVLLSTPSLPTPLQIFTQMGGLALLAQHLPLVYPDTLRGSVMERPLSTSESVDVEWVKLETNEDIYEDVSEPIMPAGTSTPIAGSSGLSGGGTGNSASLSQPSIPSHSLAAFGLFLRLQGYAEVLLKDRKKAQCLLRLVLGVTDDGEGGDIFSSPVASTLHTLPFQVLRQLFDSTPLTTDDGVHLRRTALDIGAIHLILGCMAVFTHQSQHVNLPGVQHEVVLAATKATTSTTEGRSKSDDKSHLYWAKGTGFGTGSTVQSWNVEQALLRQKSEEEHVTVLLQVLSSYINPGGLTPTNFFDDSDDDDDDDDDEVNSSKSRQAHLPPLFCELLQQSCLLPAISSYLRNDSVLDMARHIPLYRAVLQLLRAMALSPQLVDLLLPSEQQAGDELSVVALLTKMKLCVDTYASRLKFNKTKGNGKSRQSTKVSEDADSDEGLALLIPDIQETAKLVQVATDRLVLVEESGPSTSRDGRISGSLETPLHRSLEERYLEVMKKLQFDTYEMITESNENGFQFVVSYHFESTLRAAGENTHPARMKRLAQETVTLSTSLPLSYSSSVFVRCDADRLDVMKVLITGPAETPYANGCFEFDVYFPPDYPNSPMLINLETTGHRSIRFNPNLYNDGKVCLSVLNTWHGRPEEKWNAQTSSFLQVLVSIQSLILVPEPYFNEPGYERSRGTPSGNQSSQEYNSNIYQATVKWAMLEQIRNPCPCFKEVIHTHFWMKRQEIVTQIESWISDMETQSSDRRTGRAISHNVIALKRHFRLLKEELEKLKTPEGLEDLAFKDLASTSQEPTETESQLNSPTSKESPKPLTNMMSCMYTQFSSTNTDNATTDENVHHEIDTDIEMEKMVSKVCEFPDV